MDQNHQNDCSLASHAVQLLHGKRKMGILCILRSGPIRLGGLTRLLPSVSKKVLTDNLRDLEGSGIIVRRDLSRSVRHIEYDFAEPMRIPMHRLIEQLTLFGLFHLSPPADQVHASAIVRQTSERDEAG